MTVEHIKTGCFPKLFEQRIGFLADSHSANDIARRKSALDLFLKSGLPTTRNEEWKYTSLRDLAESDLVLPVDDKKITMLDIEKHLISGATPIVFVDGHLSDDLSNLEYVESGLTIKSVSEFNENSSASSMLHGFSALNAAFAVSGVEIKVSKETSLADTVQILHVCTGGSKVAFVRNEVSVATGSKLNLVESFITLSEVVGESLQCSHISLDVSESGLLSHVRIQSRSAEQTDVSTVDTHVAKAATYKTFTFTCSGKITRNNLSIILAGEAAHTELLGLSVAKDSQHIDSFTNVEHKPANTTSRQVYSNILKGSSRCVFTGKVDVRQDAQKTAAYQMNKNLLLSKDAEVDTRPQLQIDADDVKCSHGATVGQLNPTEIFYLQTRGIKKEAAEALLARGFANEVLNDCPIDSAKELILKQLNEYFK
jgi:Fe-S cluster assembly protein SufD